MSRNSKNGIDRNILFTCWK